MSTTILSRVALSVCIACTTFTTAADALVIHNVHGYTPSRDGIQSFSGVVIVDGRVERLLTSARDIPESADAEVIDGGGRTMLPGLIDAHGHVLGLGQERLQADLRGSTSPGTALDRVRAFATANPTDPWVIGRGWNQVLWTEKRFPTARELDAVIADRPVVLTRIDGHAIWVNSAALKLAGVTGKTRNPAGGQIVRDADGKPTGVFVDAAASLIERHIPQAADADMKRALQAAMQELASLGMTGVHDAGIDVRQYRLYQELGAARRSRSTRG